MVAAIDADRDSARRADWAARDRAILFTALLAGLRADELLNASVGDIRRTDDGGVLHVRGKGDKDRRIPVGTELLDVIDDYLRTRTIRYPQTRRRANSGDALATFPPSLPYSSEPTVDASPAERFNTESARLEKADINGERASRGTVHVLRPNFATELANANVSVYTLMKLLGHESMVTSQRYVDGAGTDTRTVAELNPLYDLLDTRKR
ncbi:tyrosine-type recombinase/integrase [Mycolicibacterium hodleri]|uniref:tyrosine-type recombinase/integrase n=1 Tax=Mycolicibacterium hodleri TaxID=49897 RepID=UPI001375E3D0|nr:site-specific integrase [Mycolicibacterium hodleri]